MCLHDTTAEAMAQSMKHEYWYRKTNQESLVQATRPWAKGRKKKKKQCSGWEGEKKESKKRKIVRGDTHSVRMVSSSPGERTLVPVIPFLASELNSAETITSCSAALRASPAFDALNV